MSKKVFVVINPASGRPQPVLNTLNSVFYPAGVDWEIGITQESGDAERMAREAALTGVDVVIACGGDGTVMEVASGLVDSNTPMAILRGGTANLMAVELGLPRKLATAIEVAIADDSTVSAVDMGQLGTQRFMLRVGIGFAAEKVLYADREKKNRFGLFAYSLGALKAMTTTRLVRYRLMVDGKEIETRGVSCVIDNAGNMGNRYLRAGRNISATDGELDVLITDMVPGETSLFQVSRWSGKTIEVVADPPQPVQVDGEMWGETPVTVRVLPGSMRVLVPSGRVRRQMEAEEADSSTEES